MKESKDHNPYKVMLVQDTDYAFLAGIAQEEGLSMTDALHFVLKEWVFIGAKYNQ